MIRDLIKDLAYEKITLSQALTVSKLIASKLQNNNFKDWLNKELEGYEYNDPMLPTYRSLRCGMFIKCEFPLGRWQTFPYLLSDSDKDDKNYVKTIEIHQVLEPISVVERNLLSTSSALMNLELPAQFTELLARDFQEQVKNYNGVVRSSYKEFGRAGYAAVIDLTKQKLLDILLKLDEEFPTLENTFIMNNENENKVQNIVNTHIYGNNNPVNIGAGENITQSNQASEIDYTKLRTLGILEGEIQELREIVEKFGSEKSTLKARAMGWLGKVLASAAGRGLIESIPAITEFVHNITP